MKLNKEVATDAVNYLATHRVFNMHVSYATHVYENGSCRTAMCFASAVLLSQGEAIGIETVAWDKIATHAAELLNISDVDADSLFHISDWEPPARLQYLYSINYAEKLTALKLQLRDQFNLNLLEAGDKILMLDEIEARKKQAETTFHDAVIRLDDGRW